MIGYIKHSKKHKNIILCVGLCYLICFSFVDLTAQVEDEDVNYQGWLDYNATYHHSSKFKVYGDVGGRNISPNIWKKYYIRSAISYFQSWQTKRGKRITLTYHFGLGTFFTNYTSIPNHLEIRPFQGINLQWPTFKRLQINHYVRLEEQFEYFNDTWDFGLRARYMLSGIFHWNREAWNTFNNFYLPFNIEFFWNITSASLSNDLIRITPGLGYTFNLKWKVEFSTIYQRTRIDVNNSFETNDIIFRLRLFHNIM